MNFNKIYGNLENICKDYHIKMSKVYTTWDYELKKKLQNNEYYYNDMAIRPHFRNDFELAGEESIDIVRRYFRFKNYQRAKLIADEFND